MNITSLILSPDSQIYVTHGYDAKFCYVDVYKLQYICSGERNQEFSMAGEVLEVYARYYSYIISVIYNTLIYVIK